jgi:prepilin-type N-terminal cleavage/methylation domain-containing protein
MNAEALETAAGGGTVSQPKGFTLIETLIAIVIVSLLVLIGYPKVSSAMVTTNVRGARTTIVNMIATARAVATQTNRQSAQLEVVGNNVLVTARPRRNLPTAGNDRDTVGSVQNLNAIYGVTVTPPGAIVFDPRGIASGLGGSVTISITKSGKTRTIAVDMLGRVQ